MASPVLLEVPEPLETRRLLIHGPRVGDGRIVHDSVVESLAALRAFPASLPWARFEPSVDASEQFCREVLRPILSQGQLRAVLLLDHALLYASLERKAAERAGWRWPRCGCRLAGTRADGGGIAAQCGRGAIPGQARGRNRVEG